MNEFDALLELLAVKLAAKLPAAASGDLRMYSVAELADASGLSSDFIRAECKRFETTGHGLRCARTTPGQRNSSLLIARDWYLAWREDLADTTVAAKLPQPLLAQPPKAKKQAS